MGLLTSVKKVLFSSAFVSFPQNCWTNGGVEDNWRKNPVHVGADPDQKSVTLQDGEFFNICFVVFTTNSSWTLINVISRVYGTDFYKRVRFQEEVQINQGPMFDPQQNQRWHILRKLNSSGVCENILLLLSDFHQKSFNIFVICEEQTLLNSIVKICFNMIWSPAKRPGLPLDESGCPEIIRNPHHVLLRAFSVIPLRRELSCSTS